LTSISPQADSKGRGPLHYAAELGHPALAAAILASPAGAGAVNQARTAYLVIAQ
jgi:hypothetical protein